MIKALVLLAIFAAIFAAIVATVLYLASQAPDRTLLEQVENAGQSIGDAFGGAW